MPVSKDRGAPLIHRIHAPLVLPLLPGAGWIIFLRVVLLQTAQQPNPAHGNQNKRQTDDRHLDQLNRAGVKGFFHAELLGIEGL